MTTLQIGNIEVLDLRERYPDLTGSDGWHTRPLSDITRVIIHHSVTPPSISRAGDIQVIESIYHYHQGKRGWPGIGYHALIGGVTGNAYIVGGAETIRAHASGANGDSYGVCLLGDFTDHPPSIVATTFTREFLANLEYSLGRKLAFIGHKDIPYATACPGATWPDWREAILPKPAPEPAPAPATNGDDLRGSRDSVREYLDRVEGDLRNLRAHLGL